MPNEGHETSRVSQHPDEASDQAGVRQGVDLPLHAFLLIEVPPARPKLHLARNSTTLEVTNHGAD